ncbi:MAG: hypothetical protein ACRC3B_22830 [Bacteroidia bacterium]
MKYHHLILFLSLFFVSTANAQTINWANLQEENKNIAGATFGIDYSISYGLSYGRLFTKQRLPTFINIEHSFASGKNLFDDSKTKIGAQVRLLEWKNVRVGIRAQGIYRMTKNDFVRLANFGSDVAGTVGYYKPKWFVAGEVGFDKAIVTHFKHSKAYKDNYAAVVDGWYEPATGGNFYFGVQAGRSFGRHDLTFKAGRLLTQEFKPNVLVPLYLQFGYNLKF